MKFRNFGGMVYSLGIAEEIFPGESYYNAEFEAFVLSSLGRYVNCDWGEMSPEDKHMNDMAVRNNDDRVFASYTDSRSGKKIWIITEADRSITTVLFPEEY